MLAHTGRASETLAYTKRIMRLDPFYPPVYLHCLGKAYYFLGRNEEAIEQFQTVSARMPGYRPGLVLLEAAAAEIGRSDQARTAAAAVVAHPARFQDYGLAGFHSADKPRVCRSTRGRAEKGGPAGLTTQPGFVARRGIRFCVVCAERC